MEYNTETDNSRTKFKYIHQTMNNRIYWIKVIIGVTQYTGSYLVQIQFSYTYMSTAENKHNVQYELNSIKRDK